MMDCLCATAPNEEELLRHALDGDVLNRDVTEHLKTCTICQQRLNSYTSVNIFVLSHLYRSECPSMTRLSYYCAGMLATDEVMGITSHLEVCPLCMHEVVETRRELARQESLPEPGILERTQAKMQRLIATLVPWQPQLATRSQRGSAQIERGWPRQYQANAINLSLHLSRDSQNELLLLGLLSSADLEEHVETLEGAKVELYTVETHGSLLEAVYSNDNVQMPVMTTWVDDLGNIVFKAVQVGTYLMILYLPEFEMVVEGLLIENN